ncbi:PQQ-dependent sugar dehydrogenase [Pontibacter locisalis]|uniref:PQQ-dependent sugar dehydrogenase n=1 Tax=Pontibacter locisalis TaxID=1719035 RepID=A0ABW5ITE7_9BACT
MRINLRNLYTLFALLSVVPAVQAQYLLQEAYPNAQLVNQTEAVIGHDANRLYVLEQGGKIFWLPTDLMANDQPVLFLDITDRVVSGGERGLLGLAFHPDFRNNGYFYLNYTTGDPLQTRISRFTATTANTAEPNSELILLTYNQPFDNHNGGKIAFGPDGFLYISAGDGGSGGDPQNNAQNRTNLLGKILRIDINTTSGGRNYGIPASNPYVNNGSGFREEIFAYGLRNVWKFSFDEQTNRLFAGDVGQGSREEINIITNGGNYGWRIMEGSACHNPPANCNTTGLTLPLFDYTHASGAGRSITGGFIYRGSLIPELQGKYIYGDFVSGNIWALTLNANGMAESNTLLLNTGFLISSFVEDENKELLVLSYGNGRKIYRLSSSAVTGSSNDQLEAAIEIYPNPVKERIHIKINPNYFSEAQLEVHLYNVTGQLVITKSLPTAVSEASLSVAKLPKGLYQIQVKSNAGSIWKHVILQ